MDLKNVNQVWESLRSHRVQVVQKLRVDRALLFDYLRSKGVFDGEDCELVQAEKTNERKASKLLDILYTKGTEGLMHFLDVVQLLNPCIYEKLTGQRATTRENPIISQVSGPNFSELDTQRDLDILSNHLKRAVSDLQEMVIRYERLLKEKQNLNKRLAEVTGDLDLSSIRIQTSEDQAVKAEERAKEAWHNATKVKEAASSLKRECQKAMSDRQAYLLALVIKLMASEDETKQLRKQVEEEKRRNEELMGNLQELSHNIDKERSISRRLSDRLSRQRSSVKTVEDLLDRNRELELISQTLEMEKDQAITELNELKDWAEALKASYDIVEKDKQQYQESYDNVVSECSQFKKQIHELEFQLSVSQRQESNVRSHNNELTQRLRKYQEQRNFYSEEMIKATKDRDEARRERDEMYQQCIDARREKDEALERFLDETRESDRRNDIYTAEIQALKERLVRAEEELRSFKIEKELSLSVQSSTLVSSNVVTQNVLNNLPEKLSHYDDDDDHNHDHDGDDDGDGDGDGDDNDDDDNNDNSNDVFGKGTETFPGQRSAKSADLVNSIKTRLCSVPDSLPTLGSPRQDSEILCAEWLSRLPCHTLISFLCPGDISPARSSFSCDLPPSPSFASDTDSGFVSPHCSSPTPDDSSDIQDLQQKIPVTAKALDDDFSPYFIDSSLCPVPRPRANANDRSKIRRPLHFGRNGFDTRL